MKKNIPINKGNYSMDTEEREVEFERKRGLGWEADYSDYRRNWSEFPLTQFISDYPLLVDVELSSICNLKCPMCYTITEEFGKQVNTKRMDEHLFFKIIEEIKGRVPALRLSLRGEATLHPKFHEFVRYAKDAGIGEVSTLTHGGKLRKRYAEKLIDSGIDWITISADGVWDTYENIRKPLKFRDLLDNLRYMAEYKSEKNLSKPVIKIQGIWPAIRKNPKEYYDTFKDLSDLVAFNPLIDYLSNDSEDDIEFIEEFTCPQQYQRLVIGADGLVMKCSNDEENQEVVGNINIETIHEVWHGEKLTEIRAQQLENEGFKKSKVCMKCYLPRKTENEVGYIGDRTFIVKNYVDRSQEIGT